MRIGLSYDLKEAIHGGHEGPDDAFEEYDYPETVELLVAALAAAGHEVHQLGGGREFLERVLRAKVDIVFNIAEGRGSYVAREAQVPAVLEMLGIPYTGSDPLCLAIGLDKALTKRIAATAGVATPQWRVARDRTELRSVSWAGFPFPAIVKPAYEGSSKGIRLDSIVDRPEQASAAAERLLDSYRQPVMVEEFIGGDEVTVGMLGNSPPRVLGMMRILPRKKEARFVYSLEVKRDWQNLVDYECPARLPGAVLDRMREASLEVFRVLNCRDFARVDFRLGRDGMPYFLEINPLPGLGTYSDLVIMALRLGWTHEGLIQAVLEAALQRYPQCVRA